MNRLDRRDVLRLGAVGACAAGMGRLASAEPVKEIPVALQLYSVRRECGKDKGKNLKAVVEAVAKMGYEGVEFAGYYGWSAKDLRKLLDDNGLKCAGTHTKIDTLLGDKLKGTIEFHQTIGNKFLIVPGLSGNYRGSVANWTKTAKVFDEIAATLKPLGMYTGYHNHTHEFKAIDGTTGWDVLFSKSCKDVVMQLDTGNAMSGGGDPVAILKKYPGRALTLHMKEHGGDAKTVVGEGDVKWKEIIQIARTTGGTQWFIIEHERRGQDPLAAVKKCIENFRKIQADA